MNQEDIYTELLEVKKIRQDKSVEELRKKKQLLYQAQQLVEKSVNLLQDYAKSRKQRQNEIYQFLTSEEGLSPKQLELWRNKITQLKEKEIELEENVEKAREECKKAQSELERVRAEYVSHSRNVQKFEEVTSIINDENRKAEDAKAEIEVEDLFQKGKTCELFVT